METDLQMCLGNSASLKGSKVFRRDKQREMYDPEGVEDFEINNF